MVPKSFGKINSASWLFGLLPFLFLYLNCRYIPVYFYTKRQAAVMEAQEPPLQLSFVLFTGSETQKKGTGAQQLYSSLETSCHK